MSKKAAISIDVPAGYAVELEQYDDAILIECPDIPFMHSVAYDPAQVAREALDGIETALLACMQDRQPLPVSKASTRGRTMIYLPTLTRAKLALYNAVLAQGLSKAELARRLGVPRPSVDRLLDLCHASRMDQLDTALECLGQRIELQVLAA